MAESIWLGVGLSEKWAHFGVYQKSDATHSRTWSVLYYLKTGITDKSRLKTIADKPRLKPHITNTVCVCHTYTHQNLDCCIVIHPFPEHVWLSRLKQSPLRPVSTYTHTFIYPSFHPSIQILTGLGQISARQQQTPLSTPRSTCPKIHVQPRRRMMVKIGSLKTGHTMALLLSSSSALSINLSIPKWRSDLAPSMECNV